LALPHLSVQHFKPANLKGLSQLPPCQRRLEHWKQAERSFLRAGQYFGR